MGALHKASPFDDRRSKHLRFAEQLKRNTGAHNIDDRVHSPHLVESYRVHGNSVNAGFRNSDPMEDSESFLFYPIRQAAALYKLLDLAISAPVFVTVSMGVLGRARLIVGMLVTVTMAVTMAVSVLVVMRVMVVVFVMVVTMMMIVVMREMNVELSPRDAALLTFLNVQMVTLQPQLFEFRLQGGRVYSQVDQGTNEHVPANTAENIQIKRFHKPSRFAKALIWLAA